MTRAVSFTAPAMRRAVEVAAEAINKGDKLSAVVEFRTDGTVAVLLNAAGEKQPLTELQRWEQANGAHAA